MARPEGLENSHIVPVDIRHYTRSQVSHRTNCAHRRKSAPLLTSSGWIIRIQQLTGFATDLQHRNIEAARGLTRPVPQAATDRSGPEILDGILTTSKYGPCKAVLGAVWCPCIAYSSISQIGFENTSSAADMCLCGHDYSWHNTMPDKKWKL